jgi:hypothetical protein
MKQQLSTGGTTKWQLQKAHPNLDGLLFWNKTESKCILSKKTLFFAEAMY